MARRSCPWPFHSSVTVVFVDHRTASPGTPNFGVDTCLFAPPSRRTGSSRSKYQAPATSVHRASTVRRAWAGGPCRSIAAAVEGWNRRSRQLGVGVPIVQYQRVSADARTITRLESPEPRPRPIRHFRAAVFDQEGKLIPKSSMLGLFAPFRSSYVLTTLRANSWSHHNSQNADVTTWTVPSKWLPGSASAGA